MICAARITIAPARMSALLRVADPLAAALDAPVVRASAAPRAVAPSAAILDAAQPSMRAAPIVTRNLGGALCAAEPVMSVDSAQTLLLTASLPQGARFFAAAEPDISDDCLVAPAVCLLPPGRCFAARVGSLLRRFIDGLLRELSRVAYRARLILTQACPGSAGEMSSDWARVCAVAPPDQIVDRWRERGTLTRQRLLDLFPDHCGQAPVAKSLVPRAPFRAGVSVAGHKLKPAPARLVIDLTITCAAFADQSAFNLYGAQCRPARAFLERRCPSYALFVVSLSDGTTSRVIWQAGGRT